MSDKDGFNNNQSGVCGPLVNHEQAGNRARSSIVEDMLANVFQRVESIDSGVMEKTDDLWKMSQLVVSHSSFIK